MLTLQQLRQRRKLLDQVSDMLWPIATAEPEVMTDPAPSVVFMKPGQFNPQGGPCLVKDLIFPCIHPIINVAYHVRHAVGQSFT